MAESQSKRRGNELWTLAYVPLHKDVRGEAGKVALTGEVLGSAGKDGGEVENRFGVKDKLLGGAP
jgi:hypothetical protein